MANEYKKMANDSKEARKAALAALPSNVTRIGSNFRLPIGIHQLLVADKDAFGMLVVERKSDNQKFALNLVAGTITTNEGIVHIIENTEKAGAKTLAFPDSFFLEMQCNGDYDITVNEKGYVTAVQPAEEPVETAPVAEAPKRGRRN